MLKPPPSTTFFDEQRRKHRDTWQLAAASTAAIVAMGLPVSLVITPLVYAALLIVANVVTLIQPIPGLTESLAAIGTAIGPTVHQIGDGRLDRELWGTAAALGAALIAPGIVVMLSIWVGLRALLRRSGVGGILLALNAREVRRDDLEEHQLANVAEEMAVAAGVPPPRLVMLDSAVANAALIGSAPGDAAIVVSRRLLDDFTRDETQAILGHLIGSMANGDLRIAFTVVSVFQTLGLITAILEAPFTKRSRATLFQLLRFTLSPMRRRATGPDVETAWISNLLTGELSPEGGSDFNPPWYLLPIAFVNIAVQITLFLFITVLVGPLIAILLRTRRYLADATAVQLTRNPDALAVALYKLDHLGGTVPGGAAAGPLFIVSGKGGDSGMFGGVSIMSVHPPIARRLERLHAQGATFVPPGKEKLTGAVRIFAWALFAFVGVLLAAALVLGCIATVMIIALSLGLMAATLAIIQGAFSLLTFLIHHFA